MRNSEHASPLFQSQFQNIHVSPVYVPLHVFQHYNNTAPRNGSISFSPTISPSPSTSPFQSESQSGYTNLHIKDELADKDSHNLTRQEKGQETEENKSLVESQIFL